MPLSKEEAQDLLDNEPKLKGKIAFLTSALRQIGTVRRDYEMLEILNRTTQEEWLGYARNNLKKKV